MMYYFPAPGLDGWNSNMCRSQKIAKPGLNPSSKPSFSVGTQVKAVGIQTCAGPKKLLNLV